MTEQWHVELPPISASAEVRDATGYKVCGEIGLRDHARLIAAAPDLLAALKSVRPFLDYIQHNQAWEHVRLTVDEALAKIEGHD